jgi:hypothetical protein
MQIYTSAQHWHGSLHILMLFVITVCSQHVITQISHVTLRLFICYHHHNKIFFIFAKLLVSIFIEEIVKMKLTHFSTTYVKYFKTTMNGTKVLFIS